MANYDILKNLSKEKTDKISNFQLHYVHKFGENSYDGIFNLLFMSGFPGLSRLGQCLLKKDFGFGI